MSWVFLGKNPERRSIGAKQTPEETQTGEKQQGSEKNIGEEKRKDTQETWGGGKKRTFYSEVRTRHVSKKEGERTGITNKEGLRLDRKGHQTATKKGSENHPTTAILKEGGIKGEGSRGGRDVK